MNKRAELEILINKRTLERGIFLLIILALGILLAVQKFSRNDDTAATVAQLEETVAQQTAQIEQLNKQLEAQATQTPTQENNTPEPETVEQAVELEAPVVQLSGKLEFNWTVDGEVLTPTEYNAEKIASLNDELDALEAIYDDATDARQAQLDDEMADIKKQLKALSVGDSKFKLYNVTVTVNNGKEEPVVIDYALCWPQIDCVNVKSEGIINAASGATVTKAIPLKIPTFVAITKTKQTLRLTLSQDGKDVYKQDYTATA